MATVVERTKTILEALVDRNVTNGQLLNIVEKYINFNPDTDTATNDEKATKFLKMLRAEMRDKVKSNARALYLASINDALEASINASDDGIGDT